ncbi:Lactation elevated protein 1 [Hordeum vulgare]|nr:Lactation elevated protein 1 [Hordeum vulgare]
MPADNYVEGAANDYDVGPANVFDERGASDSLHDAIVDFVHLLDDNIVYIDQAPIGDYGYDELDGGVHSHGSEEDGVEEVDKGGNFVQERFKDMEASCGRSFNLENRWKLLQHSQKWELIDKESPPRRGSLTEMDDNDEDDDGPRNKTKPNGNKKAKDKIRSE